MRATNLPDLVIFDCDGVLVDSEPIASRVFAETIGSEGLTLRPEEVDERFRGHSLEDCLVQLERLLNKELDASFLSRLNQRTFDAFRAELEPVIGVRDVLQEIVDSGTKTCVASSGSHEKMQLTLSLTGLLPLLEGRLFSATQVERGKPAPDLVLLAAKTMGAVPSACLVVEDSFVGAQGALAAGMRVLGFVDERSRQKGEQAFQRAGIATFGRMAELPALLGL